MQLSNYAIYGVLAVGELEGAKRPVNTAELAQRLGISFVYGQRIARQLVQAGLIRATRGPNGGYRLTRTTRKATLLDVVQAVGPPVCQAAEGDTLAMRRIRGRVRKLLSECLRAQKIASLF